MSKKYTVEVDGNVVAEYARKDRAVREAKYQETKATEYINVLSPGGQTVHRWEAPANEDPRPCFACGHLHDPNSSGDCSEATCLSECNHDSFAPADEPAPEDEGGYDFGAAEEPAVRSEEDAKKFSILEMKAKISKLLAKAEKTDNEHERDLFNAKAERLMLRLGIEAAELESAGKVKPEEIITASRDFLGNYSITTLPGAHRVMRALGNMDSYRYDFTYTKRRGVYVGHKTDVESFLTLLDSLMLQVMSALHVWQKAHREERRGLTDMEKYNQHRDFIEGFFDTVAKRVRSEKTEEEKTASTGAALVLASKADKVANFMQENHGDLKPYRGGRSSFGDGQSYIAGREAGRTANLGEKNLPGSHKALK